jgi:hypothetical protein
MLINKFGVETEDEVVELNSRREVNDPRNRETTTMLLQAALSAVKRSEYESRPVATKPATTTTLASPTGSPTGASDAHSHTDAA